MNKEEAIEVFKNEHPYNPKRTAQDLHTLATAFDMAISALKGGWIPMTTRPMTEEERKECMVPDYLTGEDAPEILACPLPDDGQEVEVTICGSIVVDTFYNDGFEGCYFDTVDIEDVTAWRPCEPYVKPEEGERE